MQIRKLGGTEALRCRAGSNRLQRGRKLHIPVVRALLPETTNLRPDSRERLEIHNFKVTHSAGEFRGYATLFT